MSPREVIMRALSRVRLAHALGDVPMTGWAPICKAIEDALAEAGFAIVPKDAVERCSCGETVFARKVPE
jgi:hypothetical protein